MIAGLAYELIRFAGKHQGNRVLMTLLAPGMWLQRLTTRQPSLDQLEVSIRALREVLLLEEGRAPDARRSHGLTARRNRHDQCDTGQVRHAAPLYTRFPLCV